MTRTGLNAALLAAATILGAAVWWSVRESAPPPATPGWIEPGRPVQNVSVDRGERRLLVLERVGSGWRLSHPYRRVALASRVRHLLSLAETRPAHLYAATELDPAAAGLAPPAFRLRLGEAEIELGGPDPLGQGRYLRHRGRIAVLPDQWHPLLDAGPAALADLALWPLDEVLVGIETPLTRIRREDAGWIAEPGALSPPEAAAALARAWADSQAGGIRPSDQRPAIGQVRLNGADGSQLAYELVEDEVGLGLRVPADGYRLLVDPDLADRLLRPAAPTDPRSD